MKKKITFIVGIYKYFYLLDMLIGSVYGPMCIFSLLSMLSYCIDIEMVRSNFFYFRLPRSIIENVLNPENNLGSWTNGYASDVEFNMLYYLCKC